MTDIIDTSIVRLKNGDKSAFNEVYNNTYQIVYACCFKMLKNEQDTSDVVQNIYIKLLMKIGSLNDISKFSGWLMAITYNECKNLLKTKQRSLNCIESNNDISDMEEFLNIEDIFSNPMNITDEKELQGEIQLIVSELSDEQKQVVMMYYYNQKTVEQIAKELNCSVGTSKSRLNYARKNLKKSVLFYEKKNNVRLHSSFIPLFLADLKSQITSLFITKAVIVASTLVIGTTTVYNISNNVNSKPPTLSPTTNIAAEINDKSEQTSQTSTNIQSENNVSTDVRAENDNVAESSEEEKNVTIIAETSEVSIVESNIVEETTVPQTEVVQEEAVTSNTEIPQSSIEEPTTQQEVPKITDDEEYIDEEEPPIPEDDIKHNHQYPDGHDKLYLPDKEYYDDWKDDIEGPAYEYPSDEYDIPQDRIPDYLPEY